MQLKFDRGMQSMEVDLLASEEIETNWTASIDTFLYRVDWNIEL